MMTSNWNETPLRNIVFGFPYLDTLKLNSRRELGGGVLFFGNGDENDLNRLEKTLRSGNEKFGGLFLEFPSNPLLRSPPLRRLRELADEFEFPIVVDDSISSFVNVDVLRNGADILCSSLTKQFSGSNAVMGGSLVLNSNGRFHDRLYSRLLRDHEDLLHQRDASALLDSSFDLEARVGVLFHISITSEDHSYSKNITRNQHKLEYKLNCNENLNSRFALEHTGTCLERECRIACETSSKSIGRCESRVSSAYRNDRTVR